MIECDEEIFTVVKYKLIYRTISIPIITKNAVYNY